MPKRPQNHSPKRKGATSILVIVLMVVLIVLGLAILTTSLSGVRLAQKKQNWLQSYYGLETQAALAQESLTKGLVPLLEGSKTKPLTKTALEGLSKGIDNGTLKIEKGQGDLWHLYLQVDDNNAKPVKHLTMQMILDPRRRLPEALSLVAYKQWQDAFEFKNLPGFEDPLTTPPEFNLEGAGD